MIFGRIWDAVRTEIAREVTAQREAHSAREAKEARELVLELRGVLEQLNLVAAREAKRRLRAAKKALGDGEEEAEATPAAPADDIQSRKRAIRQRLAAQTIRRPTGSDAQ